MITKAFTTAKCVLSLLSVFAGHAAAQEATIPDDGDVDRLASAEPAVMSVVGGTPEALGLYPLYSTFPQSSFICLPADSGTLTFSLDNGELRSFGEDGCNRIVATPASYPEPSDAPDRESSATTNATRTGPRVPSGSTAASEPAAHPAQTEVQAYANTPPPHVPPQIVGSSGPDSRRFPAGISAPARICLRPGSVITILQDDQSEEIRGPGCFSTLRPAAPAAVREVRPVRVARVRAAEPAAARVVRSSPPNIVIRGSRLSLAFYPIGSRLSDGARVCLPSNAGFLTLQMSSGGTLTYGDGGCSRVIDEPNSGDDTAGAGSGP